MAARGPTVGRAVIDILADGSKFDEDVRRQLRGSGPAFNQAGEEHAKEYSKGFEKSFRDERLPDQLHKALQEGKGRFGAEGHDLGSEMMDGLKAELKKSFPGVGGRIFEGLRDDLKSGRISFEELETSLQNLRPRWHRAVNEIRDGSRRMRGELTGIRGAVDKFATGWGKAFGRGSRNDFLNFFGGFMAIGPRVVAVLSGIPDAIGGIVDKLKLLRADSGGTGAAIGKLAGAAAAGVGALLATVVIVGQALALTLGPLSSAVSLLIGLILALAGSIGFALAGALVAVGGALVPFAALLAVASIALGGLMKKGSELKAFKEDWDKLKNSVREEVFGKGAKGVAVLRDLLKAVEPVIMSVASALGGLVQWLDQAAQSKGFTTMMQNIATAIGPMVTSIGKIAGNIALFLGEAFLAAGPMINEFLGWLERVTGQLADFGKGGKKSGLAKFFEDAWDSAKKVGAFISEIIGLIGDLLGAGKTTGDNIFVKLTDWVKQLRTWLADPKNSKQLQQWFDDASVLADKIGGIVQSVIDLVTRLDTPGNRKMLFAVLDTVQFVINLLGTAIGWVGDLNDALLVGPPGGKPGIVVIGEGILSFFQGLPDRIVGLFTGLPNQIANALSGAPARIAGLFTGLPMQIAGFFSGLGQQIWTAAGSIATSFGSWISGVYLAIPGVIASITSFFVGLPTKIFTAAGSLASSFGIWLAGLPSQVIGVVGQIIIGFNGLAGKIITAAGNLIGLFTQWLADLPGRALQTAVNITVTFINLAVKMINSAGSLIAQFGTWVSGVPARARKLVTDIWHSFIGLAGRMIQAAGSIISRFGAWVAGLPGRARTAVSNIISGFNNLAGRIIARAGSLISRFGSWVAGLPARARKIASDVISAFNDLAGRAIRRAGDIVAAIGRWASGVKSRAGQVADDIVSSFRGLAGRIVQAIGTIIPHIQMPHITVPHISAIVDVPHAAGGIFSGAQYRMIGEAGPEAVVPLDRSLSRVDPAVRALSAIAQGKSLGLAAGGGNTGKTIDVGGITINTPTEDPRAVASEVVAHMAAATYLG